MSLTIAVVPVLAVDWTRKCEVNAISTIDDAKAGIITLRVGIPTRVVGYDVTFTGPRAAEEEQ